MMNEHRILLTLLKWFGVWTHKKKPRGSSTRRDSKTLKLDAFADNHIDHFLGDYVYMKIHNNQYAYYRTII